MPYPKPKHNLSREDSCIYDDINMFMVTCFISNQKHNLSREDSCTYDHTNIFNNACFIPNQKHNFSREDWCTYDDINMFMVTCLSQTKNTIFLVRTRVHMTIQQTKNTIFLALTHVHITIQACSWWHALSQPKTQSFSRWLMYIWPYKDVQSDIGQ